MKRDGTPHLPEHFLFPLALKGGRRPINVLCRARSHWPVWIKNFFKEQKLRVGNSEFCFLRVAFLIRVSKFVQSWRLDTNYLSLHALFTRVLSLSSLHLNCQMMFNIVIHNTEHVSASRATWVCRTSKLAMFISLTITLYTMFAEAGCLLSFRSNEIHYLWTCSLITYVNCVGSNLVHCYLIVLIFNSIYLSYVMSFKIEKVGL